MRKILFIFISLLLSSCQISEKGSDQSKFAWQIYVKEVTVTASLVDLIVVTHYDGTSESLSVSDNASTGKTYVLIELVVKKNIMGGSSFSWDQLVLKDSSGTEYVRLDDAFLTHHKLDRLPGIDLRLGENTGWIAFEVESKSAQNTMTLIYHADEGDNTVVVKP